jgi:hypothetical protein
MHMLVNSSLAAHKMMGFCFDSVYPQGRMSIWITLAATMTSIANINVSSGCYYVQVDNVFPSYDGVYMGYGGVENLPATSDYAYCVPWSSSQKELLWDVPWTTGFAFSILATIFSGGTLIISFFLACVVMDRIWIQLGTYLSLVSSMCTWLSFIGFASDMCQQQGVQGGVDGNDCTFSIGAGLAILGGFLSCLTGLLLRYSVIPPISTPMSCDNHHNHNNDNHNEDRHIPPPSMLFLLPGGGATTSPGTIQSTAEPTLPDESQTIPNDSSSV